MGEETPVQLSLFGGEDESHSEDKKKKETIESTIDELREKYGKGSITLGFHRLDR